MNIAVVSYSYTGNNKALAECVAKDLSAKHIKIEAQKKMTMWTIGADMIFSRTPKAQPSPEALRQYDLVIFAAPVWMGQVASPLRAYLKYLRANPKKYGFLSISGGADGGNPRLLRDLVKRTGAQPLYVLDQHIKDLLPPGTDAKREDTSAYKISETEAKQLSDLAIAELRKLSVTD